MHTLSKLAQIQSYSIEQVVINRCALDIITYYQESVLIDGKRYMPINVLFV
jgi:hypothetical protein